MDKIKAHLISGKVSSNTSEAKSLFEKSRFGEKTEEKIFYTLTEAFYLVETKKMDVFDSQGKIIQKDALLKKFQRLNKKFKINYIVFRDIRKKGYIVKSALKFGADFRVYDKGKSVQKDHSKWLCYTTSETESLKWQDFAAKNRVAHSTKKNLLIAIVDEENDITYFEVKWTRV